MKGVLSYGLVLFTGILLVHLGFRESQEEIYLHLDGARVYISPLDSLEHEGKHLMETQCYTCHHAKGMDHDTRLGPPMVAVKMHYLEPEIPEAKFADKIWNFVKAPDSSKVRMKGALRRFGLMPDQSFEEEDIRAIANYLYNFEIEEPSGFRKHWKERGMHRGGGKHLDREFR